MNSRPHTNLAGETEEGTPALTRRSLVLGLPLLTLWIFLVSFSVPHEVVREQHLILLGGFGALLTLFGLKFLLDFLPSARRLNGAELAFIYALLAVGIPSAAMARVALESALVNHYCNNTVVESGERGMVPDFWAPNPHLGPVPEPDFLDARCPYLTLPPKADGTPRRPPLPPPGREEARRRLTAAVEACAQALKESEVARGAQAPQSLVLGTLQQVRAAGENARAALERLETVQEPERIAYLMWVGEEAATRAARGPACVERATAVQAFRMGKVAVPWRFWLLPLTYWFFVLLAFHGVMLFALTLLRRTWVEEERLPFPYARVAEQILYPLPGPRGTAPLAESLPRLGSWLAYLAGLGFCVAGLVSISETSASGVPPAEPRFVLDLTNLNLVPNATVALWVVPFALAFVLLFPLELLATTVFTFLAVEFGLRWICQLLDWGTSISFLYSMFRMGGMLGITVTILFFQRRELFGLVSGIWSRSRGRAPREPLSPRELAVGFCACLCVFCGLLLWGEGQTGETLLTRLAALGYVLAMILIYNLSQMRVRAYGAFQYFEFNSLMHAGIAINWHTLGLQHGVPLAPGSTLRAPDNPLSFQTLYQLETFGEYGKALGPGAQILDAYALGEAVRARGRDLFKAAGLGLILALALGMPLYLMGIHQIGYDNTPNAGSWFNMYLTTNKAYNYYTKLRPWGFDTTWILAGAALFATCTVLRRRYARFPIEPLGLFLAACYGGRTELGTDRIWFTFLLALLIKYALFRWYGIRAFQERVLPWLVALLLGMTTGIALFLFLSAALLGRGMAW